MKTVHNIILATAASVFPLWAMAQNTLTGRITDNVTGEPSSVPPSSSGEPRVKVS